VLLLAGSLGGPASTYLLLGATPTSFVLAVLISGFTAGATFWPMSNTQGTAEWL
jgi:hypothetical protein